MLLPLMASAQTVTSPNGNIVLTFSMTDNGRPTYEMTYKGKAVINKSHLGLELAKDKHASMGLEETDLMDGFSIAETNTTTFDETWRPVWGETATIRNHYNELCVKLVQETLRKHSGPRDPNIQERPAVFMRYVILRFRVYDDGIGIGCIASL